MSDAKNDGDRKAYTKTFEDELDWKLLDQLHGVVSQISNFCFETKKFCVTIEFIVLAFFAKFTHDKLDHSLFIVGFLVPLFFWFLDSVAYYYQVKIRGTMETIQARLKKRNLSDPQLILGNSNAQIISSDRIDRKWYISVFIALVNHSMWIYALMLGTDIIAWILFWKGVIR